MNKLLFRGWLTSLLSMSGVLVLLVACSPDLSPEEAVKGRANERWTAVLSEDYASAYEYLSPGYRSSISSADYQRKLLLKKVKWMGAEHIESNCTETTCKVKILLKYRAFAAVPGSKYYDGAQRIEESWVLADDNWYMVPKN